MRSPSPPLVISDEQCEILEKLSASQTASHREVLRAQALLMARAGEANTRIASELGVSPATVTSWRERFAVEGLKGLGGVRPGRGRKPSIRGRPFFCVGGVGVLVG
jgi:transposase